MRGSSTLLATAASISDRMGSCFGIWQRRLERVYSATLIGQTAVDHVNHIANERNATIEGALCSVLVSGGQQLPVSIQRVEKLIEERGHAVPSVCLVRGNWHLGSGGYADLL